MIGWYVHHHGAGHLHRARAVLERLAGVEDVTVLSSLPRPDDWDVAWVRLPLDAEPGDDAPTDPTAHGVLHWAPVGHVGLRARTAAISAWIAASDPRLVVSDVSQEVALLCRLHGVPVVSVVLPGRRTDAPHLGGLRASDLLVGCWPDEEATTRALLPDLPADLLARVRPVGGLSRYAVPALVDRTAAPRGADRRLVVIGGRGGDAWTTDQLGALRAGAAGWHVTVLGPGGRWVADAAAVHAALARADVAVVQAGQNAVAEVAAARVPAVVVPAARPFDEQAVAARHLGAGSWPAVDLDTLVHPDWPALLDHVARLDGARWSGWCDGRAADRFAALLAPAPAPARTPGVAA